MPDDYYETVYKNTYQSEGFEEMQKQMQQLQKNFNTALKNLNTNMKANTKSTEIYREKVMGLKRNMIAFFFVAREMKGLLSPAAQLVGIFDVWNSMLQVLFLPIMLFLLQNVFIPLFEFFTGLSEPIQFIIGLFITLAAGLGMIATGLNMMGLASTAMFGPWGLAIAAIIGAVILIIKYWEPIKEFFSNLWESIKGFFSDAWDKIKTGAETAWENIKTAFSSAITWFTELGGNIGKALFDAIWSILPKWAQILIEKGWGGLKSLLSEGSEEGNNTPTPGPVYNPGTPEDLYTQFIGNQASMANQSMGSTNNSTSNVFSQNISISTKMDERETEGFFKRMYRDMISKTSSSSKP